MAHSTLPSYRTTRASFTGATARRTHDGHRGSHSLAQTRNRVGTSTDVALAERRRCRALADDPARRRLSLARLSPLDRRALEPQTALCVQGGAPSSARVPDALEQRRIRSSVRWLSRPLDRPGGSLLGSDQVQHGRLRRLRAAASVAGLQDGIGGRRLGDESVHADSLDARLRERSLWLVRRGVGSFLRLRLVLKDRSAQPQAKSSAGLQGTVAGFEPPVSSLGAAAEATCRSDISLVAT
jgi:hypothetical protein